MDWTRKVKPVSRTLFYPAALIVFNFIKLSCSHNYLSELNGGWSRHVRIDYYL